MIVLVPSTIELCCYWEVGFSWCLFHKVSGRYLSNFLPSCPPSLRVLPPFVLNIFWLVQVGQVVLYPIPIPAIRPVLVGYQHWPVGITRWSFCPKNFGRNSFWRFCGNSFFENISWKSFFPQQGDWEWEHRKGDNAPILEWKEIPTKILIPKCTNQVFVRYWLVKYWENTN